MASTLPRRVTSPVIATDAFTGVLVSADTIAVVMVTPGRRPILGYCAFGKVNVDILIFVKFRINIQLRRPGANIGDSGMAGFLHYLTQIAGRLLPYRYQGSH